MLRDMKAMWTIFLIHVILLIGDKSMSSLTTSNEVVLLTKKKVNDNGTESRVDVSRCTGLDQFPEKLYSVKHSGKCFEVHEKNDCSGDFVPVNPNVPASASEDLYRWNLNHQRDWIGSPGAKGISPCRPKCHETNIERLTQNQTVEVAFYSSINFVGTAANVTVKDCTEIPEVLRNHVMSFRSDESVCLEFHERKDCSGDSIQIPRKTPRQLKRDLEFWNFSGKAQAISPCGYNCLNFKEQGVEAYRQFPWVALAITLSGFAVLILVISIVYMVWRKRQRSLQQKYTDEEESVEKMELLRSPLKVETVEGTPYLPISKKINPLWPLLFNVGHVNNHFVGRHQQLNQLGQAFNAKHNKIILISGLGGVGKTELTRKFANEIYNKGNTCCTWFNGETQESFHQTLTKLSVKIGIRTKCEDDRDRGTVEIFTDLIAMVGNNRTSTSWLVIFDDADDLYPDLRECLKLLNESENTLSILTSRNRKLANEDWKLISLEEWEMTDSIDFVERYLEIHTNQENKPIIELLCNTLGNHALGMEQAMAYITNQQRHSLEGSSYSIQDYIQEFNAGEEKTSKLLNHELSETSQSFAKKTFVTWDITISKIKKSHGEVGQLASSLLNRIVYLESKDIPVDFVKKMVKLDEWSLVGFSDENVEQALELLKSYSLVKIESGLISIHPLLQQVIRIKLKLSNEEFGILESFLKVSENFPLFSRSELTQVLRLWKYSSKDDILIRTFPYFPMRIFNTIYDFGLLKEMHIFATWSHKRFEEVFGKDDLETLRMKHNLAMALNKKGEMEKSLEIYKEVWEKEKEILGEKHESTLATASNMAVVLMDLNRLDEAKGLYEKVFDSERTSLGENHKDTMITKHNIAAVLEKKGELDMALSMYHEVLEWRMRELGERHPDTLSTRHNIGIVLYEQGKYSEAKEIFQDVSQLSKEVLGEEHPHTISSMYSLGFVHFELPGDEIKSLHILRHVLRLEIKILGDSHSDILHTQEMITEIEEMLDKKNKKQIGKGCAIS